MFKRARAPRWHLIALLGVAAVGTGTLLTSSLAQHPNDPPAFVIVERLETTGPESIQQEYAKLARAILPSMARTISRAASATHCSRAMDRSPVAWRSCSSRAGMRPGAGMTLLRIRRPLKFARAAASFDW